MVVGNDRYLHANALLNATNDARDVAEALGALGYSVSLSTNVTREELDQALTLFCRGLAPGDSTIFYYSGHGFQMGGENYLVPTDFNAATEAAGQEQGYSLPAILKLMTSAGAVIQIVILDACRDNPFFSSRSAQMGWANVGMSAGTLIAFGTSPGSTSSDNPTGKNGLFTKALLSHVSSKLSVEEMLKEVRRDTIIASFGAQTPWVASNIIGQFSVNPEAQSGATPSRQLSLQDQLAKSPDVTSPSTARGNRNSQELGFPQSSADLKSAEILVNQGLLLVRQGNYNEAARSLSAALALHPGFSVALRVLGLIFNALGRGADALAQFTRAIDIDPEDHLAYFYRCSVLTKQDPSGAIRDCEAAIGLAPKFVPARVGLANALLAVGKKDSALIEINTALGFAPTSSQAHALRARVFESLGQDENAKKDVDAAVRLSTAQQP
jgi:Tfp pilus assembly protein PilF